MLYTDYDYITKEAKRQYKIELVFLFSRYLSLLVTDCYQAVYPTIIQYDYLQ